MLKISEVTCWKLPNIVKLLKEDFSGKEIEKLYIEYNNFKIIRSPNLFDAFEFDFNHKITSMN